MSTQPNWHYELTHHQAGYLVVAGVDEAGRGAWAGPLTVAAVILPAELAETNLPFKDSKKLSATQRAKLAQQVREIALAYAVEHAWPEEIERLNVLGATHTAAHRAVQRLNPTPQALITDYLHLDTPLPLLAPAKADAQSYTVAAASLLAKTERDALMRELDEQYPGYGFATHKGYGTQAHREALSKLGVSDIHRRGFRPVANLLHQPTLGLPESLPHSPPR